MDGTGDLLMAAGRALRRRFAAALLAWEVSPGQARALRMVGASEGPIRLSTLADRLRIVPRSATEVVDALEGRGLVVRQADPTDRRATCVVLTDEGQRLLALIEKARAQAADDYLAVLAPGDRSELDRILTALLEQD